MPLRVRPEPWNDPDWLFELKYDGFRALAYLDSGRCRLVSRNLHTFASFSGLADEIAAAFPRTAAVLDGELVCLDRSGRPMFKELLYRRHNPIFVAFDLVRLGARDLRLRPLLERKTQLCELLHGRSAPVLYAQHIAAAGTDLFERICVLDLEGIVAKHKGGCYTSNQETSTWFKIRNRRYSQMVGREELFERDRRTEPVPGWHTCELACANLS